MIWKKKSNHAKGKNKMEIYIIFIAGLFALCVLSFIDVIKLKKEVKKLNEISKYLLKEIKDKKK